MSKQSVLWLEFCFKIPYMCKMITLQTLEKFLRMIVGYKINGVTPQHVRLTYQKVKLPVFKHISCVS